MRIRLLKKQDITEVAKLFVESYAKEEKSRRWKQSYAEKYIHSVYRICKDLCFVAVENEKIIGVSLAVITPEFNKQVVDCKVLLVHPNFRRKKVGSKLLRKLCIKASNKYGIEEVESSIYTLTNFPIMWYERIGFRTKKHLESTKANIANVLKVV